MHTFLLVQVVSFKDPRDACAAIAAESYKTWLEHETRTDDITLIIVHIKDMGNLDSADEVSQISLRPSPMTYGEGYRFQSTGTGTFHARRGSSITELQAFSDFTATERSPACVAPSPEQTLSFKT
ncbi:uncharacterized protein A4U43_C07F9130 [Asparagus officinalis]|uniref:Uncharacterized protein n=1 Tax=Asparagus officinalis TaxID=4686 RepID=A0A5P1EAN7_ASPOF|nr:uncharacterized protein A4U43_C07F9130 [Asparagus officinalis]